MDRFKFHKTISQKNKNNLSISYKSEHSIDDAANSLFKVIHMVAFLSYTLTTPKNKTHKQTHLSEQIRYLIVKKR